MHQLQSYRQNWQLLRDETNRVGAEVERWSYESLEKAPEQQPPIERIIGDFPAYFQVNCYDVLANGDLAVCVDAYGGPPTLLGIKPSYQFFKRRDGTVYY